MENRETEEKTAMTRTQDLHALIGQEVGVSRWFEIGQDRIDAFADC